MKTILIQAIGPRDRGVRENEVLVSRIVGWYQRDGYIDSPAWTSYKGPTTIISIDSGIEYEIAESLESFRNRLTAIVDVPYPGTRGFTGSKPLPPPFYPRCSSCGGTVFGLQLVFKNVRNTVDIIARDPSDKGAEICRQCIVEAVMQTFGNHPSRESK